MNERHLTRNDLQKYMDTSDLSEAYLLWMEQVTEHLLECPKCQAALQKLMLIDSICEEESFAEALELATQEEAVRRDLLIAKLQQMQEQARMAEVIQKLSEQAVSPIMLQMSDLQRRAGVVRGDAEQHRMQLPKGAEVTAQDGKVIADRTGRAGGRGAYLCDDPACLEKALKRKSFARAFHMQIGPEACDRLKAEIGGDNAG